MEDLRARHRKEQRDLQARITQKKKSATKKTRKGINDECDSLVRGLAEKQEQEIRVLDAGNGNGDGADVSEEVNLDNLVLKEDEGDNLKEKEVENDRKEATDKSKSDPDPQPQPQQQDRSSKPNRAKARLARRAAEHEAAVAAAEAEAASQTDHRASERQAMQEAFKQRNLKEKPIRPDGHCLYSAIAMLLKAIHVPLLPDAAEDSTNTTEGYKLVRATTASYIEAHADDFLPFIDQSLPAYVHQIRDTAEWGGQIELTAMARAYRLRICVLTGDGRTEVFEPLEQEEQSLGKEVWVAYYRHEYGLGEHYNALVKS